VIIIVCNISLLLPLCATVFITLSTIRCITATVCFSVQNTVCYYLFCSHYILSFHNTVRYKLYTLLLHIMYIHLQTLKYINWILNCNVVLYSYFPQFLLLHIMYIHLQTLKYINWILNCNVVLYSYFPQFLLLYIMYIHLQTLKYIWTASITKTHITFHE